jgi:hypothetical protein
MPAQKSGSRHALLFYRHTMGRLWVATLILGLVFMAVGAWAGLQTRMILGIESDTWLYAVGILALAISLFAFVARFMAYVQPYDSYLRVATPFLRFKVSYRRVRSFRPSLVQQIFPPEESSWSQRSFLEPFYGKTAIVVDLKGFPLNPSMLKLFLPPQMFSPRSTGFVFMVSDWMKLSTELDSLLGAWLQSQSRQARSGQARPGQTR